MDEICRHPESFASTETSMAAFLVQVFFHFNMLVNRAFGLHGQYVPPSVLDVKDHVPFSGAELIGKEMRVERSLSKIRVIRHLGVL